MNGIMIIKIRNICYDFTESRNHLRILCVILLNSVVYIIRLLFVNKLMFSLNYVFNGVEFFEAKLSLNSFLKIIGNFSSPLIIYFVLGMRYL